MSDLGRFALVTHLRLLNEESRAALRSLQRPELGGSPLAYRAAALLVNTFRAARALEVITPSVPAHNLPAACASAAWLRSDLAEVMADLVAAPAPVST